jgi:hypothetical protein
MARTWLLLSTLLLLTGCTPSLPGLPVNAAGDPARDVASWPPADAALSAASTAMGQLTTMREHVTRKTYRNDELFLSADVESAYVAPDRRYECFEGRSPVESVQAETVQIGPRFYKREVRQGTWEELPWPEPFAWPARDYTFTGVKSVSYAGPAELSGRTTRVLLILHEGSVETRNAGWQLQTRLWIDPATGYFLRRETSGSREEPATGGAKPLVQRFEGTWSYLDHNGSIGISAPPGFD